MRLANSNPYYIIKTIEFIGDNKTVSKRSLFQYLEDIKDEGGKKHPGITDDTLYNLQKRLLLVEGAGDSLSLTSNSNIQQKDYSKYCGYDIYLVIKNGDMLTTYNMLCTNLLFLSPMTRDLIAYIFKKNSVTKKQISEKYLRQTKYGHKFNEVSIDFSLTECQRFYIIRKENKKFSCTYLHPLVFGQILIEEYLLEDRSLSNLVELKNIKDRFNIKYGIKYSEFDTLFSKFQLFVPNVTILHPYQKIELNMEICQAVNFYE